jgi:hypothetical protein
MKRFLVMIVGLLLILSVPAMSAEQVNVLGYTPSAYSRLPVTTAGVVRLSSIERETAGAVFITVETNNVRYRIDGGNPTLNFGHLVVAAAYQSIWLNDPASIKEFRVIAIGGNAILHITYYKRN